MKVNCGWCGFETDDIEEASDHAVNCVANPTTNESDISIKTKVDVRIIGDHPHTGRVGWVPINNGDPETINMFGRLMVRVNFLDGTGCFVEQRHLAKAN